MNETQHKIHKIQLRITVTFKTKQTSLDRFRSSDKVESPLTLRDRSICIKNSNNDQILLY